MAQIRAALHGFSEFAGLLRIDGWVACAPGFASQPSILDGASECLRSVLGASARARAARFTPARMAEAYRALYDELCGAGAAREACA